jgi:hypothetical protein
VLLSYTGLPDEVIHVLSYTGLPDESNSLHFLQLHGLQSEDSVQEALISVEQRMATNAAAQCWPCSNF